MISSSWMSIRARGGARRGRFAIRALHGGIDPVGKPEAQALDGAIDGLVEGAFLFLRERRQDIAGELSLHIPLAAHADPKARNLTGAERRENRRDAFVPPRRTSRAHSQGP